MGNVKFVPLGNGDSWFLACGSFLQGYSIGFPMDPISPMGFLFTSFKMGGRLAHHKGNDKIQGLVAKD